VIGLAFGADGRSLTVVATTGARRWDLRSEQPPVRAFGGNDGFEGRPMGAAFSADGRLLAVVTQEGHVFVLDGSTLKQRWRDGRDFNEPVIQAAFLPDGKTLVTASAQALLQTWDAATGRPIQPGMVESDPVQRIVPSPDGRVLALAGIDGRLRWRDAASLLPLRTPVKAHGAGTNWSPHFIGDGNVVLTIGEDGLWTRWQADLPANDQRLLLPEGPDRLLELQFDADGRRLHVVSVGGRRITVNTADGAQVSAVSLPWSGSESFEARLAPGAGLVALRDPALLALYDASSGRLLKSIPHEVREFPLPMSFSADGQRLAVGGREGRLHWLTVPGLEPAGPPQKVFADDDRVTGITTAASGAAWAAGSGEGYLAQSRTGGAAPSVNRLGSTWINALALGDKNLAVGIERHVHVVPADPALRPQDGPRLAGHGNNIFVMASSADGRRLVSGSFDGTLRLWDLTVPSAVGQPLRGHFNWPHAVAFSPNGRSVASAGSDGSLRLWPVFEAWVDAVCAKLDRNPSRAEWREWVAPDIPYSTLCPALPVPEGN
jgi:WD40 repeat protein